jgi:hypothetical protein
VHEIVIATVSPEHRHRRPILPAFGTDHAPFVLVLYPVFYSWLAASISLLLFFFYNVTAGQFPWYGALSTSNLYTVWTPWSLWPWATLLTGLIVFWRRGMAMNSTVQSGESQ